MNSEFQALLKNDAWMLISLPPTVKMIGYTWVYQLKLHLDVSINRYRACLVVKSFHQTYGLDYFKTFSFIIESTTVQIILTLAVSRG